MRAGICHYFLLTFSSTTYITYQDKINSGQSLHMDTECHSFGVGFILWQKFWGWGKVIADTRITTLRAEVKSNIITKISLPLSSVQDLVSYNIWRGLGLTDRGNKMDWCTWPIRLTQMLTSEPSTPQVRASGGLVVCPRAVSLILPCPADRTKHSHTLKKKSSKKSVFNSKQ